VKVPDGYTEKQVLDIATKILNQIASTYTFGYYDIEDIKQQGYLYTIEILEKDKFDLEKSSLETFLRTCIRNKFNDLLRSKLERRDPPCNNCNDAIDGECIKHLHVDDCPKWRNWIRRNHNKKDLVRAGTLDGPEPYTNSDVFDNAMQADLFETISKNMPVDLRGDYLKMKGGINISKNRQIKVMNKIREILCLNEKLEN
jgi:DNA-directed RNA polymerase specialized sigma24 family protein